MPVPACVPDTATGAAAVPSLATRHSCCEPLAGAAVANATQLPSGLTLRELTPGTARRDGSRQLDRRSAHDGCAPQLIEAGLAIRRENRVFGRTGRNGNSARGNVAAPRHRAREFDRRRRPAPRPPSIPEALTRVLPESFESLRCPVEIF